MVFQGRSIQASVELDLKPLELSITKANEMLGKLGGAFEFKKEPLVQLEQYMSKVRDIFKLVSDEALKINQAFNNIQGIKSLIENLEIVKSKMEYIANDVDKINKSILSMGQKTQPVASGMEKVSVFSKEIGTYFANENKLLQTSLSLLRRKEKEMQGLLTVHKGVTEYFAHENELMTTSLNLVERKIAEEERELAILGDSFALHERIASLVKSDTVTESDLVKLDDEQLAILRQIVGEEEKILNVQRQQTAEVGKQNAERELGAKTTPKGNQLDSLGYLPRRIGSMALTMWGFNELMDVYDKTMGHINAESQKDYFADRLNMNAKELNNFNKELADYQKQYQKLDMTVVGANALETASKYKVENESLGDLTKVMAIYGSEFVKQGRSQEDSILAINDALDGELRRLKEVGIGAEELKDTGLWNGDESDKAGMLQALLKIAEDRGYEQTAKDITNLSDAITTLEVKLSIDLARAFGIVEPLLRDIIKDFITMLETAEWLGNGIVKLADKVSKFFGLTDANGKATNVGVFLEQWLAWAITLGISLYGAYKILKPILGMFGKLKDMTGGIGKGAEDVATTGGTVAKDIEKGGFTSEFKKLGRNLGIMARVFFEVAIGLVLAYGLMYEAMILISRLGDDYESMKPSFDKGAKFLKDYGIYILAVGGAMAVLLQYTDKLPQTDWKSQAKAFGKLAVGLGVAMLLIGEAIVLLIAPMKAIEVLGWMYGMLDQTNIQKGMEVMKMYANALNYIASDGSVQLFIVGLIVASAIFGFTGSSVAIGMAVGIASSLLLVSEAIFMLIAPLVAIELLGKEASKINQDNVDSGIKTIEIVGGVLKKLAPVVGDLLAVDWSVFADQLVNLGNKIMNGGKDGLTTLTQDIIPSLNDFVTEFNNIEFSEDGIDTETVNKVTQVASTLAPMISAIQKLTTLLGGDTSISFMGIKIETNSGIRGRLDQLYEDISAVMDFANKLGNLKTVDQVGSTAITQTADAISQLKAKLDQFVTTISSYSDKVRTASDRLGKSLPNGFKSGASTFSSTVVQVLASGISEVQARYPTMNNGGKALGQKLVDGFKNHKPTLKTIVSKEIDYALDELDDAKDDFYNRGQALGKQLSDGFESSGGLNVGSPANIARTIAKEMEYSMLALDNGKQLMYKGGQALGQALTNGYQNYGNLMTDVGVLASKGINNEQLQANARSVQANTKGKGQAQESLSPTINIDMSNSTIIGIQDLNTKIQQAVETAIVRMNSPNGATGY